MDPQATWLAITEAMKHADCETAANRAEDLLTWLKKDGFPPSITTVVVFDRVIAKATCEAIAT